MMCLFIIYLYSIIYYIYIYYIYITNALITTNTIYGRDQFSTTVASAGKVHILESINACICMYTNTHKYIHE